MVIRVIRGKSRAATADCGGLEVSPHVERFANLEISTGRNPLAIPTDYLERRCKPPLPRNATAANASIAQVDGSGICTAPLADSTSNVKS